VDWSRFIQPTDKGNSFILKANKLISETWAFFGDFVKKGMISLQIQW
jgi:hypothetical protein